MQTPSYRLSTESAADIWRSRRRLDKILNWCAEVAKARDEVSEAALAHTIPDKVGAAYLRAQFLDERRQLMLGWARYLSKVDKTSSATGVSKSLSPRKPGTYLGRGFENNDANNLFIYDNAASAFRFNISSSGTLAGLSFRHDIVQPIEISPVDLVDGHELVYVECVRALYVEGLDLSDSISTRFHSGDFCCPCRRPCPSFHPLSVDRRLPVLRLI
jgi:hypothetical protein